jgi:hypothetical protein
MAIDPATAKLLAKLAVAAATDAEARRRILALALAPVIGLLLLVAFVAYILSTPASILLGWLLPDELDAMLDFQKTYGFNQSIGIYDRDYLAGSGIDYGEIIFIDGAVDVVYFNQLDERYANEPYGTDKIGTHGCGPTALAIVVSSLTGVTVDPVQMAAWSVENGGWSEGQGSYPSLIPSAASGFGLQVEDGVLDDPQEIVDALASGKLVVAHMSKGHFTSGGHYIVLRGVTSGGNILVADPSSVDRSGQEWDLGLIMDESRKGAYAGGPFWIIGP